MPAAPPAGGTAASHALSLRTHAAGGPSVEPTTERVYDVNSLQAAWELEWPQFVYLACQSVA